MDRWEWSGPRQGADGSQEWIAEGPAEYAPEIGRPISITYPATMPERATGQFIAKTVEPSPDDPARVVVTFEEVREP